MVYKPPTNLGDGLVVGTLDGRQSVAIAIVTPAVSGSYGRSRPVSRSLSL